MKLTQALKDNVVERMVEKFFPRDKVADMENRLAEMWLNASPEAQTAKRMYEEYPDYVIRTNEAKIVTDLNEMMYIRYSFYLAERKLNGSNYTSTPVILMKNYQETNATFYKALSTYVQVMREREAFKQNLKRVLASCSTSAQIVKLVPETAECFVQTEDSTALVDKQTLDALNRSLEMYRQGVANA